LDPPLLQTKVQVLRLLSDKLFYLMFASPR
jgi:hypothetical protein